VFGCRRLVASAPLAHRIRTNRSVRDLTADVNGEISPLDRIEVLRVALPAPRNAFRQRGAGNVFHALHELDQPVFPAGAYGGEAHATVAGHHGGHAVAAGRLEQAVPAHLAVVVGVDVDESRRDDSAGGVDGFRGLPLQPGARGRAAHHLDDPAILHPDV